MKTTPNRNYSKLLRQFESLGIQPTPKSVDRMAAAEAGRFPVRRLGDHELVSQGADIACLCGRTRSAGSYIIEAFRHRGDGLYSYEIYDFKNALVSFGDNLTLEAFEARYLEICDQHEINLHFHWAK